MPGGPLLCIMGPTAAGKTDFAIELAERSGGELISVDSALVYRGLDIGAAKPDYPHHLMDIRDPSEPYSAAAFVDDAVKAIGAIRERGKLPILVGGTMLYYRALLQGLDDIPSSDPAVRAAIESEAAEKGWPAMHALLAEVDPVLAARLHPNHSQRISRGLEVWRMSGRPLSDWQRGAAVPAVDGEVEAIAICPLDRAVLHQRIEQRFDQMLREGLVDEVRQLFVRKDLHPDLPSIRAVGYRQIWAYLNGDVDLDTARQQGIVATRQLAKRQLTWLRQWPKLKWLLTDSDGSLVRVQVGMQEAMHEAMNEPARAVSTDSGWDQFIARVAARPSKIIGDSRKPLPLSQDEELISHLLKTVGNSLDFPQS